MKETAAGQLTGKCAKPGTDWQKRGEDYSVND